MVSSWLHGVTKFLFLVILLLATNGAWAKKKGKENGKELGVTYDSRSLIVNGKRDILISGSIHYPRSTPKMWPRLIRKAKLGGLDVIQTYVFWNGHEPLKGQYNFEGRYDLVRFIKEVQKQDMYLTLRIGPFIQAEWNQGGLPYWLREEPGMIYRTDNEPWKRNVEKFVRFIIDMMKNEKLFAPQGGPIILAQIENEYNAVQDAFKEAGKRYIQWVSEMAISTNAGVPWMMCKQKDAPGIVINACNGRHCGDTFEGPNNPTKPFVWTENWTAQYRSFGDPPSQRAVEDLAYGVARFFSKNGSLVNYYMYHGGTNFGRTSGEFVMTRYYDEAPLDEFGLLKDPKWGHMKDLHHAVRLIKKPLLKGDYSIEKLGKHLEARLYQVPSNGECIAFLSNSHLKVHSTVTFRGTQYFLPRHSISILPDCKTVAFNTQRVTAQHSSRTYHEYDEGKKNNKWEMYQEEIPKFEDASIKRKMPMELFNMTKDETDYLWYTTIFDLEEEDLPMRGDISPVVQVASDGHAMLGFANGKYIGDAHGNKRENGFLFQKPMSLKTGVNRLSFLGMHVGFPDNGAYLEHKYAGIHTVAVQGLNTGTFDLTANIWGHKAGLVGEKQYIYNKSGIDRVKWVPAVDNMQLTWYKRYFDAPQGDNPVALDMSTMGKGMVWINGESLGRYWVSFLNPLGKPSQHMYHVPQEYLMPKDNLMVVFEETGGKPEGILITKVKRDNICVFLSEINPTNVQPLKKEGGKIQKMTDGAPQAGLLCPDKKYMQAIIFADFGNPIGMCGNFIPGNCTAPGTKAIVEKVCLGKNSCTLDVDSKIYGADPKCQGTTSTLAVQAKCSRKKSDPMDIRDEDEAGKTE